MLVFSNACLTDGNDDWLVDAVSQQPTLVSGFIGEVPTLTLTNGLISRVFAMPQQHGQLHCPNPGGKMVPHPGTNASYPYFGLPCAQSSDCGQCIMDSTCKCAPCSDALQAMCCQPVHSTRCNGTTNGSISASGFASISLSRFGHTGRETSLIAQDEVGANVLRASSPEAVITLNGQTYNIGGLTGQRDFSFLNGSLLASGQIKSDPAAFIYKTHRIDTPQKRYEWTPGARHSDPTLVNNTS